MPMACIGSGTFTHLGLNLIQANIASYTAECSMMGAVYPCNDQTEFINILVTDGKYNSSDAQVQMPLQAMYMDGITTYVIGFGDAVDVNQLNKMADWGSGNTEDYYDANNQDQLETSLKNILEQLTFDECCSFNDCAMVPEPTTDEPDPMVVPDPSTSSSGEPDTESGTTVDVTATGTGSSTTDPSGDPSTTNDPSNPSSATETDPTTDPTDGGTGDTAGETGIIPTTGGNTTPPDPTGDDESASSSEGSTGVDTAGVDDEGCGCKVDDSNNTRGLLGTLFTLGLAGFIRRRRRA
jgi:MYXO-CTERM domain-containing protein